MLGAKAFQQKKFRRSLIWARTEDETQIQTVILPAAENTANRIVLDWERETDELTRSHVEGKPEFCQDVRG